MAPPTYYVVSFKYLMKRCDGWLLSPFVTLVWSLHYTMRKLKHEIASAEESTATEAAVFFESALL